ncbi:MAG: hypothetical protein PHC86_00820 [Eubacteriales bacterium]|nr:hypothetical protein [Eubacteriales bacterium]
MKSDPSQPENRHPIPSVRLVPARQPLNQTQHWLLGSAMIILLIILFVMAWAVRQWQSDVTSPTTALPAATIEPTPAMVAPEAVWELLQSEALARKNALVIGIDRPLTRINPLYAAGPGEQDAVALIFEPLMTLDSQGQPQLILAEHYDLNRATQQLIFTLKDDHFFRDGRVVSPADIAYTYNLLLADSYDGQLQGLCGGIQSVTINPDNEQEIRFQLDDWVIEPDWSWFTIGILKFDTDPVDITRVFDLGQQTPFPEGSGPYELTSQTESETHLALRAGYDGEISTVIFTTIASEHIYPALVAETIDMAYAVWDDRMKTRINALSAYTFMVGKQTSIYTLVNRVTEGATYLKTPDMQDAVLAVLAGQPLSDEAMTALDPLALADLTCYFYRGIDEPTRIANEANARAAISHLTDLGIQVTLTGIDWPDLASRTFEGRYDLMVMPLPANEALPDRAVLMNPLLIQRALTAQSTIPGLSDANALIGGYDEYILLAHRRLLNMNLSTMSKPLAALSLGWTQHLADAHYLKSEEG